MNDRRSWRTRFGKAPCSFAALASVLLSLGSARAHAAERELEVDLSRLGAPVSPYLHGQFIEHLGRCIHDGIWAEKLWDRKFLLEPGKTWEVVKPEGAAFEAFHDPAGAYAGARCMALWVRDPAGGACGLRQGRIGLSEGREYLGYAVLAHLGDPVPVEIRLSWGPRPEDSEAVLLRDVGREYRKHPFRFRARAATSEGSLAILVSRPAYLWLACLSLQPSDAVRGMRRDTLELLRDRLRPPVTRWPGGNFVSGYDWKDGIGERDRRPPRWERAWNDVEDNDFGVDEFLAFCKAVGTEPYIAVNAGLGSAEGAADLVEYVNGPVGTRWGDERARNGHPEPYGVRWWGVGNEMYGSWQLGNVPVERYALRHNAFVRAMKARDPEIRTIAVGAPGPWNDAIVRECGAHMDLLSAHHYTERKLRLPFSPEDARAYEERFLEYSGRVAAGIRGLVDDFRRRVARGEPGTERIRLAIDEWGIVRDWNAAPDGPGVGAFEHYYCLGDAIAVARGLHEIIRSADLVAMANWAQAVNVIGAVKTGKEGAVLDPAGLVLAEYRKRFASGRLAGIRVPEGLALDAVATWESGGPSGAKAAPEALGPGTLRVGLVNYGPDAIRVPLRVGPRFERSRAPGRLLRIEGDSLGAILVPRPAAGARSGVSPDSGDREPVRARDEAGPAEGPLVLPARSIAILELDGGPGG